MSLDDDLADAEAVKATVLRYNDTALIPTPTDDPEDPLNWSAWRKRFTFFVVCWAAFTGLLSSFSFTGGLLVQSELYNVTVTKMAYSVSANLAGLMAGPVIFTPLAKVIGINTVLFWSTLALFGVTIWSAEMTHPTQYAPFVASRAFAGFFGTAPQVLGNGIIVNIFFLHQRGRAFAWYSTFFIIGALAGQTLGGFIIQHAGYDIQFWYTLAPQGIALILILFFLEDTSFNRNSPPNQIKPRSWLSRCLATLVPGSENQSPMSLQEALSAMLSPFSIVLSPVMLLSGCFAMVYFGWFAMVSNLITVFLETPYIPSEGEYGYGFTPQQTSAFTFSMWIGVIVAQIWGELLNDRVPLLISRRRHSWRPEYRLHTLWVPGLITMPIGLGLFGAGLQYRLHYMVLALGAFFIGYSSTVAIPVTLNYAVECFERNPQEVGTCMNIYRLVLGLAVPFFIEDWRESMTIGWVFGLAAFVSLFSFLLILLLMWQGARFRCWSFGNKSVAIENIE